MLPPLEGGRRAPRQRGGKDVQGAEACGERPKRSPRRPEPQPPGWTLRQEDLQGQSPAQRRRYLLFADVLQDVGTSDTVFPRESADMTSLVPDPREWGLGPAPPEEQQQQLLGVLKAAEARGRVRSLRLRYMRMRAEEILLLIHMQKSARAAMRLEMFLPPHLKPTRIPDPLSRQERRRVETILVEKVEDNIFPPWWVG